MKNQLITSLTLAAVFSALTMTAQAAPTSGSEKPRCKPGTVAKLDKRSGTWSCKPIGLKAKTSTQPSRSAPALKPVKKTAKPARAKPDLIIKDIIKMPGYANRFQVKVQNIGTSTSAPCVLLGEDKTGLGGGGTIPVPKLKPTFFSAIVFDVPSSNIDRGDRIRFFVDAYKKVNEKNENNNVKYYTVK